MKYSFLPIALSLAFAQCQPTPTPQPAAGGSGAQPRPCACAPDPRVQAANDTFINKFLQTGISQEHWYRLREPVLHEQGEMEIFRLSVEDQSRQRTTVYRLQRLGRHYSMQVREFVPRPDRAQDSVSAVESKMLTEAQWRTVADAVAQNCFWNMPAGLYPAGAAAAESGTFCIVEAFSPYQRDCHTLTYQLVGCDCAALPDGVAAISGAIKALAGAQ